MAAGIAFTGTGTTALAEKNETLAGISSMDPGRDDSGSGNSGSQKSVKEIMKELQAENAASGETTVSPDSFDAQEDAAADQGSQASDAAADQGSQASDAEADQSSQASDAADSQVVDTSLSGTMAFAQCDEYINIRTSAGTDGDVVGKIYNNGSATILGRVGDWYEVQTGNVTGYVNADYFLVGAEADAIAQQVAYNVATVHPEALMVRAEPDENSEAVGMAKNSDQLEVVAYDGDWMKVALGGDSYGYVNAYYVDYDTYYATGETLEEEQERLDAQWLDYLEEQRQAEEAYEAQLAAEQAAAEAAYQEQADSYTGDQTAAEGTWMDVSGTQAAADAAYQEYLAAQAAADEATQQADEQLVYDTAAAAQAAYQEYLTAQNAADEAAAGYTDDQVQAEDGYTDVQAPAEETWTDGSSDAQAAADAAYQEYLTAQAAADEATQQADEQLVYDTAAAAQAAYQEYLNAQNAADEAAVYGESAVWQEPEASEDDQTAAEETWTDDQSSYEEPEAEPEPEYTEPAYTSGGGQSIVDFAVQFVGNPYVWGGTSLTNGADCSGFTQAVFANFGIGIPRTAAAQSGSGTPVDLGSIQPGDLLFYEGGSGIGHVSIYMGGGQVVHASNSSTGIIISDYGYRTPVCARRYW